jgi:hypothetical protein
MPHEVRSVTSVIFRHPHLNQPLPRQNGNASKLIHILQPFKLHELPSDYSAGKAESRKGPRRDWQTRCLKTTPGLHTHRVDASMLAAQGSVMRAMQTTSELVQQESKSMLEAWQAGFDRRELSRLPSKLLQIW